MGVISEYFKHQPWLTITDQVEAIKVQMAWLAQTYTQKFMIVGYSCGAHLGALLAHQTFDLIESCILISGVYDRKVLYEIKGGDQLGVDLFPMDLAVPVGVKFYLINAECDLNLKKQTYVYYHKLYEAGVFVKTLVVPGTTHWTVHRQWGSDRSWVMDKVDEFLMYE
jgi:acetyl esterase/lipase